MSQARARGNTQFLEGESAALLVADSSVLFQTNMSATGPDRCQLRLARFYCRKVHPFFSKHAVLVTRVYEIGILGDVDPFDPLLLKLSLPVCSVISQNGVFMLSDKYLVVARTGVAMPLYFPWANFNL